MQKTVKRTILACIAGLLMTIGLSVGQSEKVQAYGNDQIYGLVFWGTSGVSRMYGDLGKENYENNSESAHIGTEEQVQHLWTSTVKDYGYLNYAKFSNYWVEDANSYATKKRVSKGQGDLSAVLSTLNSDDSYKLKFGYIPDSEESWDECKTAVVIWAGEDWVVRNSTGTDAGLSSASALQLDWMGQICAEEDTGGTHQFLDSANPRTYTTGEPGTETQDLDLNVQEQDVDYDTLLDNYMKKNNLTEADVESNPPSMDKLKAAYDYKTVSGYTSSSKNGLTGTKTVGYTHKLVFDNSYLVSEEHLKQYSYDSLTDNYDITLEHILDGPTDAFPADSDLPDQTAVCFGRLLSGYTYTVEFLQQDTSKSASTQYDGEWDTLDGVWVPEYIEARMNEDYPIDQIPKSAYANGEDEYTVQDNEVNRELTVHLKTEWKSKLDEEGNPVYDDDGNPKGEYILISAKVDRPAYYIWHELTVQVPYRTDEDRAADFGYADSKGGSYGTIEYGGFSGAIAGVSEGAGDYYEYTDDITVAGVGSTSYTRDAEAEASQNYDENGNPCSSHGDDTVPYEGWYTDLSKPIMKVVTEDREVEGWIPYWKNNTSQSLKVYVFGLGPYNKAIYEDQMDEHWDDNSTNDTEVEQTKRIDKARQTWNSVLNSELSGGKFMELWDSILDNTPYYRFQNISVNDYDTQSDAQHGKWYDRHTYQDIFHMIWSTVLADNPDPEGDPAIDMSLYSLSSSLTSYANNVLFAGRDTDDGKSTTHSLSDIAAAGVSGAGAALGCGDEDYDFSAYLTTSLSMSASTVSYAGLLENNDMNAMYKYARYGHLLADLGIDETGEESLIATRSILGNLMSVAYIADAGLVMIWDLALSVLKTLNPFQILKYASSISGNLKAGMYDSSDSLLLQWASNNAMVQSALEQVGRWYDILADMGWVMLIILFVVLIASLLLIQQAENRNTWGRIGRYAIRFVFIVIGVPLMGLCYTEVLNNISDETEVASVPATEMVKATFVDFGGWVDASRLNPLTDMTLESDGSASDVAGYASDASVEALRKSASVINTVTGIMPDVDTSKFTGNTSDVSSWNNNAWTSYNVSSNDKVLSDSFTGETSYSENWSKDFESLMNAFDFIQTWANGDFYYASDFGSYTMARFSGEHDSLVGRQKGIDEDTTETKWNNDNTLFQLYENCVGLDNWMDRSQEDNTAILTNTGSYAGDKSDDGEEHDWSTFNVFANGTLVSDPSTVTAGSTITYTSDGGVVTRSETNTGRIIDGTDITKKTGLSTLSMYNYLMTDFGEDMLTIYSPTASAAGNIQKSHYSTTLVGSGVLQWMFFADCFVFMLVVAVIGIGYALGMMWSILKHSVKLIGSIPFAMLGVIHSIIQAVMIIIGMILEILITMLMYDIVCQLMMSILTLLETPVITSAINAITNAVSGTAITTGGILGSVYQILPECMDGSLAGFMIYLGGSVLFVGFIAVCLVKLVPRFLPVIDKTVEWSLLHMCVSRNIRHEILQNEETLQRNKEAEKASKEKGFFPIPSTANI